MGREKCPVPVLRETYPVINTSATFRYGVAAAAVAVAVAIRLALEPALGPYSPYLPFALAVIVASRFGGRWPGLAATALSVATVEFFFLEPRYSFRLADPRTLLDLAMYATVGAVISILVGQLRESLVIIRIKSVRLEQLNTALEMAHAMVRTADGVITYWSEGAAAMYGWPKDEAVGRRSHDLLKTEFPKPLEQILDTLMKQGAWEGELRHRRRDGTIVLAASHWALQRDPQGRPLAVVEVNNDITALRQAEKAVAESEGQFRTLANAIPQLCWIANADGWIFWYNERWYEYTGTTPKQMEGWSWQSVHDPKELPTVLERWRASIATGEPFDMVFPLRGADGLFRPFLTRVMPVRGSEGKVVRWFGTNTDISEQRKIEQALRESEERLRLAQQVARVGTFEWDIQKGVDHWTPELEAIYGLPPGGFDGTHRAWEQLVHPLDRPEAVRRVEQSLETGAFEGEWRVIRPDGAVRWLFGRGWAFRDESGRPLRLIGVNIDITERKQAEEAAQQKTELINLSHDAVISANPNRVITTWNKGAEETYGWTEAEAVGNVLHRFLGTESSVSIADIDRMLLRDGRWDGELGHMRRDGKPVIVESRQVLRRNETGHPAGILEINRDITDRKRLEDQFRQAQKLEGIGRLAGGVAHDFNNLLTVISGYAQMALDDMEAQHPLRDSMEEILKSADRATGLTRQLLVFSRRQVSEPKNIVLNDLVRDFEKMLRRLIGEDVRLVLSLDPAAGVLHADAGQIEQVMLNLAVNARDAMPNGGTLSIETSRLLVDEDFARMHMSVPIGPHVMLVVSDTGSGMSPDVKAHLFEPFFTTKEPGKGTGLGLSTVYGIVKQSEGSIWVYSEPGRGSAFKIIFPAVETEIASVPSEPPTFPSGDETILIAEDEPGIRGFVRQVLERHGYTVLEASNGREALDLARIHTGPIHLVIADVVMPEVGGPELASRFEAEHPGIPVLFVSGYSNREVQLEEMGAGYVQKPFTSSTLLNQVRQALDPVSGSTG
jgi:two-component system, cell cycle sensor histidine kinase and response regulator CckA